MSENSSRLRLDTLRSAAGGSWATYQVLGSALSDPARILKFTNNGTLDVFVSVDATNAFDILPANSFLLLDLAANKQMDGVFYWPANTQFYVKSVSGAAGAVTDIVYLSVYHDGGL